MYLFCVLESSERLELELRNGTDATNGNVYVSGKPVCQHNWDKKDADVVCHELGFPRACTHTKSSQFGMVPADFGMNYVACKGTEQRLKDCPFVSWDNCGTNSGAGVVCQSQEGNFSLKNLAIKSQFFALIHLHRFSLLRGEFSCVEI